ncbi:hypothetical protein LSAT2_020795, partial [Lamellibrachia satsuma]
SMMDNGTRCVKLMPVIYNVLTRTAPRLLSDFTKPRSTKTRTNATTRRRCSESQYQNYPQCGALVSGLMNLETGYRN